MFYIPSFSLADISHRLNNLASTVPSIQKLALSVFDFSIPSLSTAVVQLFILKLVTSILGQEEVFLTHLSILPLPA